MAQLYPRILAELLELERSSLQDRSERLDDETCLELFLNKLDGRSYVLLKAAEETLDSMGLGNSEVWMYEDSHQAQVAYEQMLNEARNEVARLGVAS